MDTGKTKRFGFECSRPRKLSTPQSLDRVYGFTETSRHKMENLTGNEKWKHIRKRMENFWKTVMQKSRTKLGKSLKNTDEITGAVGVFYKNEVETF